MSNLIDSVSAAPGADDNASGVAALLEIARVLFSIDTTYSLRFAVFSGEEQGLKGSSAYATFANTNGIQIPLLINLDMIGHPENPANPTIIVERDLGNDSATNDAASQAFANQMAQAATDYTTINTSLGPIYSSDYMPFEHFGYVCIGVFDGADAEPFYHTSSDTLVTVNMGFCTEAIRMVLATILTSAGKQVGAAMVFDPDPITTSGDSALTTASPGLDAQRRPVSLEGFDPTDAFGKYHLSGTYCYLMDTIAPAITPPALTDGIFVFKRSDTGFNDVMAYYHIDRFRRYLQTLGFAGVAPTPMNVDAHGNMSNYNPVTNDIVLAQTSGTSPSDAEDAGIILHEYGHAIQATQNPGFTSSDGLGSGLGDLLPALYYDDRHANWAATRGITAPWAGSGRRHDRPWMFDNMSIVGKSARGEIWASTLFEIYRNLGGDSYWLGLRQFARDLVLKLHLMANPMVPASGATPTQMAQQLEASDGNIGGWRSLANGLHRKVIFDAFQRRNLAGYPAKMVDVFIDDSRNGGYQWLENYWETQDIWVRPLPYTAAELSTASPADHQEPAVGAPAYLYVRVKNMGTSAIGSGTVIVKAYHCIPGMGLVWPISWSPMNTPSLSVANILPGNANAVIVGPFEWTPTTVGHECVLVIAECSQDQAVTQTLALTDRVEHSSLVPFDNNIAQRNLAPVSAKMGSVRGFYINNPLEEEVYVNLDIKSNLPQGWRVNTDLSNGEQIQLAPFERRWVEMHLERLFGADVADFHEPQLVQITALIRGKPIGGMTFYLAPPSAFAAPLVGESSEFSDGDLYCLNIPWRDCELSGTIRIKVHFRRK